MSLPDSFYSHIASKIATMILNSSDMYLFSNQLVKNGYTALPFDNSQTLIAGGMRIRTFEKDGILISIKNAEKFVHDGLSTKTVMADSSCSIIHQVFSNDILKTKSAIKDLIKIADHDNVTLYAKPNSLEDYKLFGFEKDVSGTYVVRYPK